MRQGFEYQIVENWLGFYNKMSGKMVMRIEFDMDFALGILC